MSKRLVYTCGSCKTEEIHMPLYSGLCWECNGNLSVTREASDGETNASLRKPFKKKVSIDDKLQYLDRLIEITKLSVSHGSDELFETMSDRLTKVCFNIEKDLGMSDDYDVLDTRTMDGKGGLVKVPIGNMYDPSVLTEMWESEHVASKFVPDSGAYMTGEQKDSIVKAVRDAVMKPLKDAACPHCTVLKGMNHLPLCMYGEGVVE